MCTGKLGWREERQEWGRRWEGCDVLVEPSDALRFGVQFEDADNAWDAVGRVRVAALDECRADDETLTTARLAHIFVALAHDRSAVLRDLTVRMSMHDTRELLRDCQNTSVNLQHRDDL